MSLTRAFRRQPAPAPAPPEPIFMTGQDDSYELLRIEGEHGLWMGEME